MPMENFHGCVLTPANYSEYSYKKCAVKAGKKCIDHVYGIKNSKSELHSMRYNKSIWTESEAKSHCKTHNGKFEKSKKEIDGMEDKVIKIFKGEIKAVDEAKATVTAKISDQTIDRYNDIILASAWKKGLTNFKKHPVLLSSHRYGSLQSQIGKVKKVWVDEEEKALMAEMEYYINSGNAEADWGFTLAKKGMAAYSVGFIPKDVLRAYDCDEDELKEVLEENGIKPKKGQKIGRVYKEVELLENSHVTIPANPSALQKGLEEEEDPTMIEVLEMVKTIDEDIRKKFDIKSPCACDEDECGSDEDDEDKLVEPYKAYPINEKAEKWDENSEEREIREWAGGKDNTDWSKYKKAFLWSDGEDFKSYKALHHALKDGSLVTHWRGVVLAMVRLLVDSVNLNIPADDKEDAYNHLAKHYEQFEVEAPEFREYKSAEDVMEGCNDVVTASVMLDSIYEAKTAKLIADLIGYVAVEQEVKEKIAKIEESIVDKISDKISESLITSIKSLIKDELEINADVIINTFNGELSHKQKNTESKYIEELLGTSALLKKSSA